LNRFELRQLAEDRIADAAILLASGRWSGAYYLAGYALECGLKACIARLTTQDDFPRDRSLWRSAYTHNLEKLLRAAGSQRNCWRKRGQNATFSDIGVLRGLARNESVSAKNAGRSRTALQRHHE